MIKSKVYVIQDKNTGLFVSDRYTLEPLGGSTRFYKSRSEVKKNMTWVDDYGMIHNNILDSLVYNEYIYPWYEDITKAEFDAKRKKYNLKVVECEIRCKEI